MATQRVVVFVNDEMGLGGIETLLVKVANSLAERGARVIVAASTIGPLQSQLDPKIMRFIHRGFGDLLRRFPSEEAGSLNNCDVTIVSLHPWSLVVSVILNKKLKRSGVNKIFGFHLVTDARAFFFDTNFRFLRNVLRFAFFLSPRESTYFMNETSRRSHEEFWQSDLSGYPVATLPLAKGITSWNQPRKGTLRIVSVGRLAPSKAYNRAAAMVIGNLRKGGMDVIWDIWGEGIEKVVILDQIYAAGLTAHVRLRGELDYDRFDATVVDYDLFVGMGTSLLEAARLGVPSIAALESSPFECYGYIHQAPLDSIGDRVSGTSTLSLESVIRSYSDMSDRERGLLSRKSALAAEERSTSVVTFRDKILSSQEWKIPKDEHFNPSLIAIGVVIAFRELYGRLRR